MSTACSPGATHEEAARALRVPFAANASNSAVLTRELVRYATLAPSSHNTQCWKFRLQERSISIEPDLSRRCPVVDPDDHYPVVSLGCASENLVQAARANGLRADARFDPTGAGGVAVALEATKAVPSLLFQAITERQCTRGDYDGKPLSTDELRLLEQAGTGRGVRVMLLTERLAMEKVLEYVVSGNTAQMNDHAFIDELMAWIRFSASEAAETGDGLYSGASGNPSLPRWLGSRVMGMFFTPKSENERYARQVGNSAGIAVFASDASDKGALGRGRPLLRALCAAGHGARHPQCVPESTGRGRCHPAAVRCGARARNATARSGGAFRTRSIDADVDAAAGAGCAGLSRRIKGKRGLRWDGSNGRSASPASRLPQYSAWRPTARRIGLTRRASCWISWRRPASRQS